MRMQSSRRRESRALEKLVQTMFILCVLVTWVSALTTSSVAHAESVSGSPTTSEKHKELGDNCQFRGREPKSEFRLEGEPVILRCPLPWPYSDASASSYPFLTWRKMNSSQLIPGDEPRLWVKDASLWVLPAVQRDSGTYICTFRNASHCEEISIELKVFKDTEASLTFVSYLQISTASSTGLLVCPDLKEFIGKTGGNVQWYKGSVLLDRGSKKFLRVGDPTRLLISNTSMEDAGYYRCVATFIHKGTKYNITRNIKLRVEETTAESTIPVIVSPLETIPASLGSRLIVPCKVFLGTDTSSDTIVWWIANSTFISVAYPRGRVTEGLLHEYSENDENYVEVSLIFDPVTREDLNTDFKCVVKNPRSVQSLHTTIKEVSSTFSWGIALAPLSLVFLAVAGIWMHRRCKQRAGKTYGLTKLRTDNRDFPSSPSQIKEMK